MSDTVTQIQARPKYIQEYDEALLARILEPQMKKVF